MKNFLATTAALFIGAFAHPAYADHTEHSHDPVINALAADNEVQVEPGEAVIIVHGIVCSFCSQGVTKKLSKLPYIDPSKYTKGVKVEISDQKVTIAIKPDMDADFDEIFSEIKSGGYEPVKAYIHTQDGITILEPGA